MLILTVIQGPDKGRRFELPDDEPQIIGRSSESLPLLDQTISRRQTCLDSFRAAQISAIQRLLPLLGWLEVQAPTRICTYLPYLVRV